MRIPQAVTEVLGRLAFGFQQMQPFIPMHLHVVLSALFPIYAGANASLTRPSSAAKPKKASIGDSDEDDFEYRMEGTSVTEALLYPVFAGAVLTTFYFIIKFLEDPTLLNLVLAWFLYASSIISATQLVSDILHLMHSFVFPGLYVSDGKLWQVDQTSRRAVQGDLDLHRASPLPGLFSKIPLPEKIVRFLWTYRELPSKKFTIKFFVHGLVALRYHVDVFGIVGGLAAITAIVFEVFVAKKWWITNLFGFAFSYNALMIFSPTSFGIGTIMLAGLFFYDIVMVFYTPMMVGVATALDVPIKLVFPRPGKDRSYGMLGLGDIVLPGIIIALALRFDLYLHYLSKQQKRETRAEEDNDGSSVVTKAHYIPPSKNWGSQFWTLTASVPTGADLGWFQKPYFHAGLVGYVLGMMSTLIGLHFSNHPQPALLYLVPGVLGAVWLTALCRGELKEMINYTEDLSDEVGSPTKDLTDDKKQEGKKNGGMLSNERREAIERRQLKMWGFEDGDSGSDADTEAQNDEPTTPASDKKVRSGTNTVERMENKFRRDKSRDLIFFSISTHAPLKRGKDRKKYSDNKAKDVDGVQVWASSRQAEADGELPKKRQRIA